METQLAPMSSIDLSKLGAAANSKIISVDSTVLLALVNANYHVVVTSRLEIVSLAKDSAELLSSTQEIVRCNINASYDIQQQP